MKTKALGTHDIARICLVTPTTVGRWIQEGKLPSFTTGGGHRRVWAEDVANFLKQHNFPIPPDLPTPPELRILIADDEETIRKFFVRSLQKLYPKAKVETAADGYEVGYKMLNYFPDIV